MYLCGRLGWVHDSLGDIYNGIFRDVTIRESILQMHAHGTTIFSSLNIYL